MRTNMMKRVLIAMAGAAALCFAAAGGVKVLGKAFRHCERAAFGRLRETISAAR